MDKFNFLGFTDCASLPFEDFDRVNFSVYVLDKNWNYLFVNKFAKKNLGAKGKYLKGKNMWVQFPQLVYDPTFRTMRNNTEKGAPTNTVTTSPLTGQRLNIVGYPLTDCFFFFASILPTKEELLLDLRKEIAKERKVFEPVELE